MDTQHPFLLSLTTKFIFLLFITSFFHHTLSFPTTTTTTTTTTATNALDFIRSSCNTTLYPTTCYTSLSPYANAIRTDPAQLARIAIGVTLIRLRHVSTSFSNITQITDYSLDPRATSALHDCSSTFHDAVQQVRESLKQMTLLTTSSSDSSSDSGSGSGSGAGASSGSGEPMRFEISNVQTWMSAALTNEDTCTDGFQDVGDSAMKEEVVGKVSRVKELTSNALALVNTYADSMNL